MDYKSIYNKLKQSWVFSAIVTIVLGLILVLFPAAALSSVSYVVGGIAIAMGVIRAVRYFKQDHTYPSCSRAIWWWACSAWASAFSWCPSRSRSCPCCPIFSAS